MKQDKEGIYPANFVDPFGEFAIPWWLIPSIASVSRPLPDTPRTKPEKYPREGFRIILVFRQTFQEFQAWFQRFQLDFRSFAPLIQAQGGMLIILMIMEMMVMINQT